MHIASAVELAEQPGPQAGRLPHVFHGDLGGAALELEVDVGAGALAAADLDPAVVVGRGVFDDLDFGIDAPAVALEQDAVAVALAGELGGGGDGAAAGEPFGHAGGVGDEGEDPVDRRADGAGVGEGDGAHVGNNMAVMGGNGGEGGGKGGKGGGRGGRIAGLTPSDRERVVEGKGVELGGRRII